MAGEVTTPMLPCADVDGITEFYAMLGFERTYRQLRPNPYVALRREDLHLHFFGIPGFDPEQSYGSCVVQVPDIGGLFEAFAAGMRAVHGKLLVAGIPRMTRPRARKNAGGVTGFSVVDPGGNWIRIVPLAATASPAATTKLGRALENAVVLADSHGDVAQALKILSGALARAAPAEERAEAEAYRDELRERLS
jgi:catechol 2,3-dioxygenase-like lactoylglutathione lyase family enzyme